MKRGLTLPSLYIPALLTLILVSTNASARHWQWRQLTPPEGAGPTPLPRALGTAIYDPIGQRIIIFGGRGANGFLNDLWSLDLVTGTWVEISAGGIPPDPRRGHNAIYDPIGHQTVVWAGQGSQFYNDIWTLDLTVPQWQNMSPKKSPETRYGSASIYDPVGQQLVQFAGFTSAGRFNDTQGFDLVSKSWQDLSPPGLRPIKRCLHTAALHSAERRMIIFGGQSAGPLNDLWIFDLATNSWSQAPTDNPPPGRFFTTSFMDSSGSFVVFGGSTSAGNTNQTWSYDFGRQQWNQLEIPNPPPPRNSMMGTLVAEDQLIIFGGTGSGFLNDLWELSKATDETHLWFAQFGNGGGFVSSIVLTNPAANDQIAGSVQFLDDHGQALPIGISKEGHDPVPLSTAAVPLEVTSRVEFSIPPFGAATISTDGQGEVAVGSAVVTSEAVLGGVVRFEISGIGIAGVGASQPLTGFIAPVRRKAGGINTGVAIHNTESQAVTLDLALRTTGGEISTATVEHFQAGEEIASKTIENFAANGHLAEFINELFPEADTKDFQGVLVVNVTGGKVAATALELGTQPGEFTTLPVTPLQN